jgi:hypothetical protein
VSPHLTYVSKPVSYRPAGNALGWGIYQPRLNTLKNYCKKVTFSSNIPKRTPRTVAYLRVSTVDQDTEKNRAAILQEVSAAEKPRQCVTSIRVSWMRRIRRGDLEGMAEEKEQRGVI